MLLNKIRFFPLCLCAFVVKAWSASAPITVSADPDTGALFRPSAALFVSGNSLTSAATVNGYFADPSTNPSWSAAAWWNDLSAAGSGVPLLASGVVTFTGSSGTGNFARASGATLTSAALNGTLGATTPGAATVTSLTDSGLTAGRVPFASTAGLLADAAALTFNSGTGALSATSFVGSGASLTSVVNSITGTAGNVTASGSTGAVTLSLPAALTSINSITSVAATALALNGNGNVTINTTNGATLAATFSGANMTLAGNLTGSGTGTSSFVGSVTLGASGARDVAAYYINNSGAASVSGFRYGLSRVLNFADGLLSFNLAAVTGADTYQTLATGNYSGVEQFYSSANVRGIRFYASAATQTAATPFTPTPIITFLPSAADFTGITTPGTSTTAAALLATSAGFTGAVYAGSFTTAGAVNLSTGNGVQWPAWLVYQTGNNWHLRDLTNSVATMIVSPGTAGNAAMSFSGSITTTAASGVGFRYTLGSVNVDTQADGSRGYMGTQSAHIFSLIAGNAIAVDFTNSTLVASFKSTVEATTGGAGSLTTAGGIYAAKKLITASSLTTAAGVTYDFGADVTGVTTTSVTTEYLTVVVNGSTKKIALVTSVP